MDDARLRRVPAFEEFDEEELRALARVMREQTWPDRHVFMREGELGSSQDAMYAILEGRVRVRREKHGTIDRHMGPGELFGVLALIGGHERTATVVADGPVRTAALDRGAFGMLFRSEMALACKFQMLVARQLARDFTRLHHQLIAELDR